MKFSHIVTWITVVKFSNMSLSYASLSNIC